MISESSTNTISSISSLIIEKVVCPGTLTDIPSAIVLSPPLDVKDPFLTDSYIDGNDLDWTPTTLILGFFSFMAIKTPAASPPPPIGTYTSSTSGKSSRISNPITPWAAMIWGSSKACIIVAPVFCAISFALADDSS